MYKKSTGSKVLFQETQGSPILSTVNNENKLLKRSNSANTKHKAAYMATGTDMQENALVNQSSNSQGVLYSPSIHDQLIESTTMMMNNHHTSNRHNHLKSHVHHPSGVKNGTSSSGSSRSYLHLFSSLKRTKKKSSKNKSYRSGALNDVNNVYYDENQISNHVLNEFNRCNTSTSILANRGKSNFY